MDTTYILNQPETLKYFYSSIFQGYCALITLGAMFLLYLFDKLSTRKSKIEELLDKATCENLQLINESVDSKNIGVAEKGIVNWVKENVFTKELNENYYMTQTIRKLIKSYDDIEEKENDIKSLIPVSILFCIFILFESLLSLLLIDISYKINETLFRNAIFLIIVCFISFIFIYKIGKISLKSSLDPSIRAKKILESIENKSRIRTIKKKL